MGSTSSPRYSWSALPSDLLFKIANTLDTRIDVLQFRAVCYSWRSSIPLPSKTPQFVELPFHVSFQPFDPNPNCRGRIILTEWTVYVLEPLIKIPESEPKMWVIKIHESESGKVILKQALLHCSLVDHLPKALNLLDYKIVEICKTYEIGNFEERDGPFCFDNLTVAFNTPLAVSSGFDHVDDSFVVMAELGNRNLAVWKMGNEDWAFINDNSEGAPDYDCLGFHNGNFLAVRCDGFTLTVDPVSLEFWSFGERPHGFPFDVSRKHLVKLSKDCCLVDRNCIDHRHRGDFGVLKIYKLNEEKSNWVELDGLKDHACFLNNNNSFSIYVRDFAGRKGNCVYLSHANFDRRTCSSYDGIMIWIMILSGHCQTFHAILRFFGHHQLGSRRMHLPLDLWVLKSVLFDRWCQHCSSHLSGFIAFSLMRLGSILLGTRGTDRSDSETNHLNFDAHPGFEAGIFDLDYDNVRPLSKFPGYSKVSALEGMFTSSRIIHFFAS